MLSGVECPLGAAAAYVVGGYSLIGARGGWSGDDWSIYAGIRNVLDEDYVAYDAVRDVARDDAELLYSPAPGSVYIGVERRF